MTDMKNMTEEDWKKKLTPEQYAVLRGKGTEAPFTGKYTDMKADGMYHCAACGAALFSSSAKFESGTGWPSFYNPANRENVELRPDNDHGINRTEVICKSCGSHLGHVFDDAVDQPTRKRYCINSCALEFEGKKKE
ncbi:MAG: Peptide methionine sulfoxide reductase MsrB [Parcubacteria group bacterium GW2011_GWA2_51_12]|nr:MAG: Peptide methionine sulfoxide reductase MsrB [Parcubacteria group bacterium GW2011_GWA2_51_12]